MNRSFFPTIFLFIGFGFFLPLLAQQGTRANLAVMDLETRGGLSQSETGTLTDRLRSMLVGTQAFNVVDRGKMDAILKEVGFQQTGCTTTECAVEVGKILNVQQMVTGSLGKLGQTYTLDISVIDVATSQITKSFSRDYKGEIDGLLDIMKEMAAQLAGIGTPQPTPLVTLETGSIQISTEPVPAGVYLDNKLVGSAPMKIDKIAVGEHTLKVIADDYNAVEKKIIVQKDKTTSQRIKLEITEAHKGELAQKEKDLKLSRGGKGGKTWLWIGGAVVAGGAAAAILAGGGGGDGGGGPINNNLPPPVWPPQ